MTQPDNTQTLELTFQLDDPVSVDGTVTPQKAAAIIERMGKLLAEERAWMAQHYEPKVYYR